VASTKLNDAVVAAEVDLHRLLPWAALLPGCSEFWLWSARLALGREEGGADGESSWPE
jgi:hypothetical protein